MAPNVPPSKREVNVRFAATYAPVAAYSSAKLRRWRRRPALGTGRLPAARCRVSLRRVSNRREPHRRPGARQIAGWTTTRSPWSCCVPIVAPWPSRSDATQSNQRSLRRDSATRFRIVGRHLRSCPADHDPGGQTPRPRGWATPAALTQGAVARRGGDRFSPALPCGWLAGYLASMNNDASQDMSSARQQIQSIQSRISKPTSSSEQASRWKARGPPNASMCARA
jgi:hypothetical protein